MVSKCVGHENASSIGTSTGESALTLLRRNSALSVSEFRQHRASVRSAGLCECCSKLARKGVIPAPSLLISRHAVNQLTIVLGFLSLTPRLLFCSPLVYNATTTWRRRRSSVRGRLRQCYTPNDKEIPLKKCSVDYFQKVITASLVMFFSEQFQVLHAQSGQDFLRTCPYENLFFLYGLAAVQIHQGTAEEIVTIYG